MKSVWSVVVGCLVLCVMLVGLGTMLRAQARPQRPEEEDDALIQKRFEYFYHQRAFPLAHIPAGARLRALEQVSALAEEESKANPNLTKPVWKLKGPKPIDPAQGAPFGGSPTDSGRVAALAVDPANRNTVYMGAAEGGVWKTTDAGLHWRAITDQQLSLSIGSIAIDPSNSRTIYVGTGEGNFSGDEYYGAGILKSANGGKTWTQLAGGPGGTFGNCGAGAGSLSSYFAGSYIGAVAVNPSNRSVLLAGVANCPSNGVFRSADGGNTWTEVLSGAPGTSAFFVSGSVAYAAIGAVGGNSANGVYMSNDGGATWSPSNGTGTQTAPSGTAAGRITLVAAPSNPSVLYSAYDAPSGAFLGLYKTTDGGAHWSKLSSTPDFCSSICWYDMAVVVSPVDPNIVYAGGVYDYSRNRPASVVGSNDGGNTWTLVGASTGGGSGKVHTDVHAFAFAADGSMLYVGSDGGVWSTADAATPAKLNWTGLNTTIATAQFYAGFAVDANKVTHALGGTQDNGSILYAGHLMWSNVTCGDGGFSAIDATTKPSTYYAACTYSQGIVKSTTGGGANTWFSADSGINFHDPGLFIPPMVMDPSNPQTLYYGTNRVYRTTNGASAWTAISPQPLPSRGGVVSTIAASASDPKTIYEGASDGTVAVTTNGGTNWTDLSPGLPGRYVSHIAVDPKVSTIAYVTYSGFSGFNGDKQGHVFRTSDGGMHWTDVSGNLPNIPVDDLVVDPASTSTLYAATDVGVFFTTDTGTTWAALGTGLPNVAVLSLVLQQKSRTLAAATHGRSVWYLTGF